MLNLKEISERIEQPILCKKEDVNDLQQLCVNYPYSQVFPLLYLKALAQNNDVRLDTELEKYACFITDRTVLYHLLHSNDDALVEEISNVEIKDQSEIISEAKNDSLLESESSKEEQNQPEISLENKIAELPIAETIEALEIPEETQDQIKDEPEVEENIEILKVDETKEIEEIEETHSLKVEIEEQLPNHAIDVNLELKSTDDSDFESQLLSQAISSTYSLEKEEEKYTLEKQLKKDIQKSEIELESEKIISDDENSDENSIENVEDSKKSFSNWLSSNANNTSEANERNVPKELINKFIDNNPKIKQNDKKLFEGRKENAEFFSPSKKAKQSLDDQQLPVSETLAKIFAVQGNFSKAIYAYQQLMLIIPEKKIFFAVQIEELEKKLNK